MMINITKFLIMLLVFISSCSSRRNFSLTPVEKEETNYIYKVDSTTLRYDLNYVSQGCPTDLRTTSFTDNTLTINLNIENGNCYKCFCPMIMDGVFSVSQVPDSLNVVVLRGDGDINAEFKLKVLSE